MTPMPHAGVFPRDQNALGQAHAEHPDCKSFLILCAPQLTISRACTVRRRACPERTPQHLTPHSNYVDPETRVSLLVGVSCTMGGLCLTFMAARLYTRGILSKKGLGLDDYMMLIATTLAVALVAIVCVCARYGTGYHQWDLRPEWSPHWGKATFCQNLAMVLAATFTKVRSCRERRPAWTLILSQVSILLTYLYIFPQRSNEIFCWAGIIFISLFGAANVITTCLQCS